MYFEFDSETLPKKEFCQLFYSIHA